jgi:DNA-binding transcriptional ArsR family regulator
VYFTKKLNRHARKIQPSMPTDQLSRTFAAIADPTRRAILSRLSRGEAAVNELAEPFQMSLPAVSKHLKVLQNAGLIERSKHAQWRPCKLRAKPLQDAGCWIEGYRTFWEQSFDRLDDYLKELQSSPETTNTETTQSQTTERPRPHPRPRNRPRNHPRNHPRLQKNK